LSNDTLHKKVAPQTVKTLPKEISGKPIERSVGIGIPGGAVPTQERHRSNRNEATTTGKVFS
jgi:hypothetical protein